MSKSRSAAVGPFESAAFIKTKQTNGRADTTAAAAAAAAAAAPTAAVITQKIK